MLKTLATKIDLINWKSKVKIAKKYASENPQIECKFFETPKVVFRYREKGSGQTIVFAADPPITIEHYDELLEVFSQKYRVIIVELPAMGFSIAKGNFSFDFENTNNEIAAFLRYIAGPKAILAFSCVAGLAALDIATRFEDLVSELILIQTTDWGGFLKWKASRDPKNILGKPVVGQIMMKKLAVSRVTTWLEFSMGKKEKLESFSNCACHALNNGAQWAMASAFQCYLSGENPLKTPKQPISILWGLKDKSHPKSSIESSYNVGKNVEIWELDELGHFPELEDTNKIYEIFRFIIE